MLLKSKPSVIDRFVAKSYTPESFHSQLVRIPRIFSIGMRSDPHTYQEKTPLPKSTFGVRRGRELLHCRAEMCSPTGGGGGRISITNETIFILSDVCI